MSTLDDLRGRTVYSYGEGGTPEYTIEALLAKNGLEGTFNLEFKSSPLEVLNMMQQQDGCVAILPQPFVSLAKILVNPLYIPIDLTVEWDRAFADTGSQAVTTTTNVNKQFLEEQAIANKKLSEGQIAEVKALLENATAQLESIKTDLSEKVHSENVKCYRNIQDLFNEFDSKIEKMDEMEQGVGSVKGYVKCLSWFAILNFVVLIGFILYSLGVFNF